MQQIQQAKQGLEVYLEANSQYIEEKVYNQFNVQCIQHKTLETLDIQKMIKTIKEIFDFGDNKVYEYFFSHLDNNIKEYIKKQYQNKAAKEFYQLDVEKLTEIVKFCIKFGFDYEAAKKKDLEKNKKNVQVPPPKAEPEPEPQPKPKPKPVRPETPPPRHIIFQQPQPVFTHVKPRISTFLEADKIPEKKEFKLQKFPMPQKNVLPRYLTSISKSESTIVKEEETTPTVAPIDQSYLIAHRKAIQNRLLKLFNFYVIQQANSGVNPTFDIIKGHGQSMSLGKFMQFCQYTRVFNCKEMTKDSLMIEFKKISGGRTHLDFQVFERLIQNLDEKYLKFLGHDPVNNPMPTYEARLMLNEPAKLGQIKKERHLIFGTRQKQGRIPSQQNSSLRYDSKELTAHSGRLSSDLTTDLKLRSLQKSIEKPKAKKKKQGNGLINLQDLTKMKLPKLSWIEDDDESEAKVRFGKKLI